MRSVHYTGSVFGASLNKQKGILSVANIQL